jgi:hypothetical protein
MPTPAPTLSPAEFSLGNLTINHSTVATGESVIISVYVLNTGDVQGSYTARLMINGSVEETKESILAGGASTTVSFTVTKYTAGTYGVEIGGQTGEFTVSAPAAMISWLLIGGIIAPVVIVGIVSASLLTRRRGGYRRAIL